MDCIGPYAKIENCQIYGTDIRVTAYASGYPDTFFSVPARCSYKRKYIGGYFMARDEGPVFVAYNRFANRLSVR